MPDEAVYHLYLKVLTDFVFRDPNLFWSALQKRAEREVLEGTWDRLWENISEWSAADPQFGVMFGEDDSLPDIPVLHIDSEDEIVDCLYIFLFPYDFAKERSWPPLYWALWYGETGVRQFCFFLQDHKHGRDVRWMIQEILPGEDKIGPRIFDLPEMSPQRFVRRVLKMIEGNTGTTL